ncbi:MAG: sugar kinase [Acidobacteriota bacterium]
MATRPARLLVIGDVAWDILVRPERELVWGSDVFGRVELMPGGAAANVAVWARRIGAEVTLVGKVGDDTLGELMLRHLRAEGLSTEIPVVPGKPTMRIGIVIDPRGEHGFVTDHSNPLSFSPSDLPTSLLDHTDCLFFNGYGIFTSRTAEFMRPILGEARRRGIPIAFDPSSFTLIGGYGPQRLLAELGPLDLLLANAEETRSLCQGEDPATLGATARTVVVKEGADGASAFTSSQRWRAEPAPAIVVDTTGAGDAFDAAYLVEYLASGSVDAALAAGNKLGAYVASHVGAQPKHWASPFATSPSGQARPRPAH